MISLLKPGDVFSLLNLLFGFVSMIFIIHENFRFAVVFILLSMLCDGADGLMARKFGNGKLGENLDSIADFLSFSISPSILVFSLLSESILIIPSLILYVLCSALRLSSFYIFRRRKIFVGLPVPAAGGVIVMSSIIFIEPAITGFFLVVLSLLMISNIAYPKMDKTLMIVASIIIIAYIVCEAICNLLSLEIISLFPGHVLLASFIVYVIFGPIYVKKRFSSFSK